MNIEQIKQRFVELECIYWRRDLTTEEWQEWMSLSDALLADQEKAAQDAYAMLDVCQYPHHEREAFDALLGDIEIDLS